MLEFAPSRRTRPRKTGVRAVGSWVRDEELKKEIMTMWDSRGREPPVWGAEDVGPAEPPASRSARCTVERLMRELGIAGRPGPQDGPEPRCPAPIGPVTCWSVTSPRHAPNPRWVADITYVATAVRLGATPRSSRTCYSRRIVGWQVADHLRAELALDALEMAIWARGDVIDDLCSPFRSWRAIHFDPLRRTARRGRRGSFCRAARAIRTIMPLRSRSTVSTRRSSSSSTATGKASWM